MWCPSATSGLSRHRPASRFELLMLALGSLSIVGAEEVKSLEKRWAKHRKESGLDLNGEPNPTVSTDFTPRGPDGHAHSPTFR